MEIANGSLSHNQLAAVGISALGNTHIGKDSTTASGAETLFKSSLVLAYKSEDFYSKQYALNLLSGNFREFISIEI